MHHGVRTGPACGLPFGGLVTFLQDPVRRVEAPIWRLSCDRQRIRRQGLSGIVAVKDLKFGGVEVTLPPERDRRGTRHWMSDSENMIEAVKQGDRGSVRALLETDDRLVNQRDESGATPLHYATLNGHRQIVQLLLERGADINSTDSQFGATPAGWAIPEAISFASSSERHEWKIISTTCPRIGQLRDCGAIRIRRCSISVRDGGRLDISTVSVRRRSFSLRRPRKVCPLPESRLGAGTREGQSRRWTIVQLIEKPELPNLPPPGPVIKPSCTNVRI